MSEITISTFEAKCSSCGNVFSEPLLPEMSYGEFIFCSENGGIYAHVNAFEPSVRLIEVLLPENFSPDLFRFVLAFLADKVFGKALTPDRHCPKCSSSDFEYFGGQKTGKITFKRVTYQDLLALSREEIIEKVKETASRFEQ